MKKRNVKLLSLKKKTVSNLAAGKLIGGSTNSDVTVRTSNLCTAYCTLNCTIEDCPPETELCTDYTQNQASDCICL